MRRYARPFLAVLAVVAAALFACVGPAGARPTADEIAPPLPVIAPTQTNWQPKFPSPYDQTRNSVTDAEITAEGEMCQWYSAQYNTLMDQIDNVNVNIVRSNGDYGVDGNAELADAVAANIDQSVEFLTPRVAALTIIPDFAGDMYFPLYQGESFYRLWQQLSNVSGGIRGRQPVWFYGPSLQHAQRWGSRINRSHVCR
ncbi:hypothetical protein ACAG26_15125 [Mycobacterium sp. pUA109]|uniref:hypothetical protein n=1 Tax=Mycobacterium sp. pUA109 TaxID=3238982 RepID=UPI00351AC49B